MNTPVSDFVKQYAASGTARLHMPGHKGQSVTGWEKRDITEISGAGELYTAEGPVGEGEANTASLFGTARTCWATEGSSQCIRAMLALATQFGQSSSRTILAGRNAHRAFLTACALLDLKAEWLWPEGDYSLCSCPITAESVEDAFSRLPELPAAVYLTAPDYLGGMLEMREIAAVCHRSGVPLLVDNAHGAYLRFLTPSQHPADLGADLCCDSAHKTLPALTGCAYLHVSKAAPARFAENAKRALALFGSTSPSWLLLQSLDEVNLLLETGYPERLRACIAQLRSLKAELSAHGWCFTGDEPMKLTIDTRAAGYTGGELADLLRERKIECEYADPDFLVLMPSPWSPAEDLNRLEDALLEIPVLPALQEPVLKLAQPEKACSIREAMLSAAEEIPAEQAAGRILAAPGVSCPPAVAVVVSGERIPEEAVPILLHYGIETVSVIK